MTAVPMSEEFFNHVAERFRALGEASRLRILNALRGGECSVGDLVERTGLSQANLSKHLQLLYALDFVQRRKDGLFVYYRLADEGVFQLCDIMCGRLPQLRDALNGRRGRNGRTRPRA
ncbi:MAG TPA: metalloregulator ArsR/SmtB family transcription factor [Vicinamibacterales bacterium]|nr:metalloregulator ArsR/SmtB family transcription factor [Vicinamibacterales bacterium]